jgi:hypothetical protein
VVCILKSIEPPIREEDALYSEQQLPLNPTNTLKQPFVTKYVAGSELFIGSLFNAKPFSRKQPPLIVSANSRFPGSFLSQPIKATNNKREINIFLIEVGLGSYKMRKICTNVII